MTEKAVQRYPLPAESLLQSYVTSGAYTDCFTIDTTLNISLREYIAAFYGTRIFGAERLVLKLLVNRPSTLEDVRSLARGETETFAAWRVEARRANQLLLCDFRGSTRSWLMVIPKPDAAGTKLLFGSAVVPQRRSDGKQRMGAVFRLLFGFHQVYSRVLLAAAKRRLHRDLQAPRTT